MAISAPGVGSGLDIDSIVSQLMALERRPITSLDKREATYQAQLSAYGSVKSAISSFQTAMAGLAVSSRFIGYTAASSDTATVGASVSGSPTGGSYSLEVTTLAQAQKLVATGQASDTAEIGTGAATTLTFDFGTISGGSFNSTTGLYTGATFTSSGTGAKTVSISSNNTLAGIRDAINAADIGVTAAIVNDGSGTPYRLVLSGAETGADQSVKISVSGDATLAALLAHDPAGTQNLSEKATAKNAAFKVDGISVTKDANTVTDVIPGVTLSLLKTTAGTPVTLNVAQDTTQITASVNAFTKAYNDLNKLLKDATSYNATTRQGAVLNGDATIRSLQSQMRSVFSTELTGVSGAYTLLSEIGVAFQKDGTLGVDSAKLQAAIAADPNAIAALFAATGSASDALVTHRHATSATQPGTYALTVDTIATRGVLTGSAAAALTITAGVNDTIDMKVDGTAVSITLTAGVYTAAALAAHVQSTLNGASAMSDAGLAVTVTESGGVLAVKSDRYGSSSKVEVTGGNGAVDLLGAAPVGVTGLDAAGSINGVAATGSGQELTGATGNDAEGLSVTIAGGATGARGTVSYSTGYAYRLEALAEALLSAEGMVTSRITGLNTSIDKVDDQRDAIEERLVLVEQRYRDQFTALDKLMASMNNTSSFLQQQLANLPTIDS